MWFLLACTPTALPPTVTVEPVPWSSGLPALPRGLRTITHLHSPWSHDACDDAGILDGVVNEPCLDDLRAGLCTAGIDVAFLSDHPAEAALQPYEDLFHSRPGDVREGITNVITCEDGRTVTWYAGIEDDLMPFALPSHLPGTPQEREDQYNRFDAAAVQTLVQHGAPVFMSHTEGRDLDLLEEQQDAGLTGVELWSLHAMFAPNIREDDLGLDPLGWAEDIGPFLSPDSSAEPDLLVLAVLELQPPSLMKFDHLAARGPIVATLGTDAHQNVLPITMRDGDRVDSYRRMLRWMSNHLLPNAGEAPEDALAAGRSFIAFEILGTPVGFDLTAGEQGMGEHSSERTLTIGCPTLHPESPRNTAEPEIEVHLVKDGTRVATGCGDHTVQPGVYRVEVEMTPHHLTDFLGDDPEPWVHAYPWILSNPIWID